MKVLILSLDSSILNPDSGGYSRMREYATLVEELHVFVFYKNRESTQIVDNKSRIDANNLYLYKFSASIFGLLKALFFGRRLVREKQFDVVSSQDPFETGLLGFLISKFSQFHSSDHGTARKVGLNVQLHGDFYGNPYWRQERLLNRLRWHLGLLILRRARSIRVVSERVKNILNSKFDIPYSKIIKVPIYTDIEYFRSTKPSFNLKQKYPQFNFIILAVANLVPVKNLEFLIRAMRKLHEILPNAGLVVVGDGPLHKKLKTTSYKLQANDYIILEGAQKDLVSYYKGANCFVLVSKYEGWGRAVVEAASSGLPIVMTEVGLVGELIKNEKSGIVLKGFDEDKLVRALSQIYFNGTLRKQFIEQAQEALNSLPTKEETLSLLRVSWESSRPV